MPFRRPRRRTIVASIVAATTLLLGGGAIVQFRAARSWSELKAMANDVEQRVAARQHLREPLWGEATTGSAFAAYERTMATARTLAKGDRDALLRMLRRDDAATATDAEAIELRQRWLPVLTALHDGAHATDATPPPAPATAAGDGRVTDLLDARWVANAAMFAARALRHQGNGMAAVQHSLDAATFAADLHRRGTLIDQMIATATAAIAMTECWPEAALEQLDGDALAQLAVGLERLDPRLPMTIDHDGEMTFAWRAVANAVADEPWMPSAMAAWRYGFSTRWMLADALLRQAATNRDLARATELDWPQREALIELEIAALLDCGNPLTAVMVPNTTGAERNLREVVACVRLLRMSIARHRGLDLPPLRDPLGDGPLAVTHEADGRVRLHSAGSTSRRLLERIVGK